jgi:hypothetical protein
MAAVNTPNSPVADAEFVRAQWIARLTELVERVEGWACEMDLATRRIETTLEDLEIGPHRVPALLMQDGPARILFEPVGRNSGEADGIVDLYRMSAYDDVARIWGQNGVWMIQRKSGGADDEHAVELKRASFESMVGEMRRHAA